ncbi:tetratricopeptide repeat protein, partial [bacterium]|nr:tetratricopeptide repeat protein [bacterium]
MLLLSLGLLAAPVQAQAVQEFNTNAITAMKAGKWGEAQAILKQATELYDGRALTLFGPRFGSFWYNRGYCELMLGMYPDAMKSFEKCYKKYPNGKGGENESINLYHKKSLLYWGHAAKGAGAWDVAIKTYKKFLAERDPTRDKYQPG